MRFFLCLLSSVFCLLVSGCGYTTKSLLPADIKSIDVPPAVNSIDLSEEVSDKRPFRVYRPGLEVDVTNAVINRFIFDGNLRVASEGAADARAEIKLMDYRRDPLRFSSADDVQEYRLSVATDVRVFRVRDNFVLWSGRIAGDTTYFLGGPRAISEDLAIQKAVEDLARRIVDKTIEIW